jgi:hypothetical protein
LQGVDDFHTDEIQQSSGKQELTNNLKKDRTKYSNYTSL